MIYWDLALGMLSILAWPALVLFIALTLAPPRWFRRRQIRRRIAKANRELRKVRVRT